MAVTKIRTFKPTLPRLAHIEADRVAFDYDRPSDTLFVYFDGRPLPAISVVVSDELLYLVDPDTEHVLGLQIEAFLSRGIDRFPALLDVAERIGLTPTAVARDHDQSAPGKPKRAAVTSVLGFVDEQARVST